MPYFVNQWGCIEHDDGALLYDDPGSDGLDREQRKRLAELHTIHEHDDPDEFDWLAAREQLIQEGLMYRDPDEPAPERLEGK